MLANYHTLRFVAHDLNNRLAGRIVATTFSQNKNELVIVCPGNNSSTDVFVVVLCDPSRNALYLRPAFARARKNTVEFFPQIHGKRITAIAMQPADRDIRFSFENGLRLALQMFGSKANAFLADQEGTILGAFLRPKDSKGIALQESSRPVKEIPSNAAALAEILRSAGHKTVFAALKEGFPPLGPALVRELLFRAGLAEDAAAADLTGPQVNHLFFCCRELLQELERLPSPRIYFRAAQPHLFSIIELRVFKNLEVKTFSSIHEAVRAFLASSHRQLDILREKTAFSDTLDRELQRAEKTLARITSELGTGTRALSYETMGKLLMTNLQHVQKGMKSILLENIFLPTKDRIEIELDPALSPAKNAERYFEKAKKARHAVEEAPERKRKFEKRCQSLRKLLEGAETLETPEQWKDFILSKKDELRLFGIKTKESLQKKQDVVPPFRIFRVDGGFEVWAGKRNDNNDLLTFKYARPNDLWFHARGPSGSHVVLRKGTGKGEISKRAIEQAAAIAAYYSKMKTSGLVPVAVTERKYVRKPRGAPAGTVAIQREKVLMVKPGIPRDTRQDSDEESFGSS